MSWRKEHSESLQRNVCTMRITAFTKTETQRGNFALVVLLVLLGDMTRYFLIRLFNNRACEAVSKIASSIERRPIAQSSSTDKTTSGRYLWTDTWRQMAGYTFGFKVMGIVLRSILQLCE